MFEKFTDRARKIMALANQEAQRLQHHYIGTEHILLGLVREGSGVGANVLKNLGVDLDKVRSETDKLVRPGPDPVSMDKLPQTPRGKKVIEYAIEEARSFNHNYIGSEHILLGLIREHDGVAAQVLMNLGLKLPEVREEVLDLLGVNVESVEAEQVRARASAPAAPGKIPVGIVGVSGYGGGEALRLCAGHPTFDLVYVAGESSAGQKLADRFPGIVGKTGELVIQKFDPANLPSLDVLFASLPTGESKEPLSRVAASTRVVDIGGDHRYAQGWTYGLADVFPDEIKGKTRIANPGCFPAATLTALAPLLAEKLIEPHGIIIDAKTGVSGAGRGGGADAKFGYGEVNEDLVAYGLLQHVHMPEMIRTIAMLAGASPEGMVFTPHLIPMTRGILATIYAKGKATTEQCLAAARKFYDGRPFVRVTEKPPHTKWAAGSNLVFLSYAADPSRNLVIALAAIDNLGKGAAGQAIQNANLITGQPETAGLTGAPLWP